MRLRYFEEQVERLDRGSLRALQWHSLQSLVAHAYENSAFYRSSFNAAGITPDSIRSLEDFQAKVPTINKQDMMKDQAECPPYGQRLAIPEKDIRQIFLTSGTSGLGQEVHAFAESDMQALLDGWARALRWVGIEPGDTAYLMMPIGTTAGPVTLLASFQRYGLKTFSIGHMGGTERLTLMKRFQPHFISTGPVYLRRLTHICEQEGMTPREAFPELKAIKLGTFGYDVPWVQEMEEVWGAHLFDTYASTQLGGGTASSCEAKLFRPDGSRGMLHFPEHKIYVEIINPKTGLNAEEDEEGEVVVTPLCRWAMPLIRFRTGDRVIRKSHRQCSCGRPFDGIEAGTVSRYDSMMKIRGVNLWPEAIDAIVFRYSEVKEYNGRVGVSDIGQEVVDVMVAFKDEGHPPERLRSILEEIQKTVKEHTGVSIQTREVPADKIETFDYKEKRWKDLRANKIKRD